tara:strand:- start:7226 stop:7651 length:426 start_codon:yes stop_codon:yes gene_type:complete
MKIQQSKIYLHQVNYESIKGFKNLAKKERVSLTETKDTMWFHVKHKKEIIGCCAIHLGRKKTRLKGSWLLPQYRGRGSFKTINDYREKISKDLGYKKIEVLTLHKNHYAKRGFKLLKETKNKGVYHMEKNYLSEELVISTK